MIIERIVAASLAHPKPILALSTALAVTGVVMGARLELDALPDVTGNLVVVLTNAPGFSPEEVERLVTRPVEAALGGMPGVEEQRSLSRYGISSVTTVFDDAVDPFLARQWVQERLNTVAGDLPDGVDAPALGPYTGGLGEIFQFTLGSPVRTQAELYELAELDVGPLLKTVPGVVEVNTWGGAVRTLDVVVDPVRMARHGVTLSDVEDQLSAAIGTRPGASLRRGEAQSFLRSRALPAGPGELGDRVITPSGRGQDPRPVRLSEIGQVVEGQKPRTGTATQNGRGETVYVMVQMLRGANALEVMDTLHDRMDELRGVLPADVQVDVVYDRSTLVQATLRTVFKNLLEGGILVVAVLFFLLGSIRAGLLVALSIPLSMLGAVMGMVLLGIPGNLMSLGAIDFGLLVDGAVVMTESFFHAAHDPTQGGDFKERVKSVATRMARPVFFSVLIILLVYVPVVTLTRMDGKMFRPMAATVILALATSLVLVLTFVPAASVTFLRPSDVPDSEPQLVLLARRLYQPQLAFATAHPRLVAVASVLLLSAGLALFMRAGTTFVPQLDEGDLVIQTTRAPDIAIEGAAAAAARMERALIERVPEVKRVASRIGSPAVATDIMGLEQADVFVNLEPTEAWRPGLTKDALVAELEAVLAEDDPDSEAGFTQPIQMRFNELVGGETTDVALSIYGPDLRELRRLAEAALAVIEGQRGAVDARITAPPELPLVDVVPNALAAEQSGLTVQDVLTAVTALRAGVPVGDTYEGRLRIPVRLRVAGPEDARGLAGLGLPAADGRLVPLARVARVEESATPALVNHKSGLRRIVVGFNVRGESLGDVVTGAEAAVRAEVKLPPAYRLEWGGQFATLNAAKRRMAVVIPAALAGILVLLVWTFGRLRPALLILTNVPFAGVGGMIALAMRGLPVSISAAVGFIALSGIAVLNGVVLVNRLLAFEAGGMPPGEAAHAAALTRMRPVLMTALVAALGFLPMMLATGVGAEVQRPLATVVVGGLVTSTLLTLLVIPSLYPYFTLRRPAR
jgi:cobalt-zinc-cadmium resistance protein CzcA